MSERRSDCQELRSRRTAEPGTADAYDAARLAFEFGRRVRELRVQQGLSQTELARRAGTPQPAVARFEAGGTVPTLPVLERLARSLGGRADCTAGSVVIGRLIATGPALKVAARAGPAWDQMWCELTSHGAAVAPVNSP
jgi:DNA-binding XRE family transcriptional regulator